MKSEIKKINIIFVKKVNDGIYSFNAGLEKIVAGDGTYSKTTIYDLPNMLASLLNGKLNYNDNK